jgi:hypothetical protein
MLPAGGLAGTAKNVTKGLSQKGLAYQLKHLNKHLPGTAQSEKLIRKEGAAHVFNRHYRKPPFITGTEEKAGYQ